MPVECTEVHGLNHSYETNSGILPVLSDISLRVEPGETISIIGPSGCGKSTLLMCIAGLVSPSSGQISVSGSSPRQAMETQAIGFAFQDSGLLAWRTVRENICLPIELCRNEKTSTRAREKVDRLLSLTHLTKFQDFYPGQLSGGMKQRVSLARALILDPKILLLDEPFGALDLLTRTELSVELSRIIFDTCIPTILVTHSLEEAVFLGTRVLFMSKLPGSIQEELSVDFALPRSLPLLSDDEFMNDVKQCRSIMRRQGA